MTIKNTHNEWYLAIRDMKGNDVMLVPPGQTVNLMGWDYRVTYADMLANEEG